MPASELAPQSSPGFTARTGQCAPSRIRWATLPMISLPTGRPAAQADHDQRRVDLLGRGQMTCSPTSLPIDCRISCGTPGGLELGLQHRLLLVAGVPLVD